MSNRIKNVMHEVWFHGGVCPSCKQLGGGHVVVLTKPRCNVTRQNVGGGEHVHIGTALEEGDGERARVGGRESVLGQGIWVSVCVLGWAREWEGKVQSMLGPRRRARAREGKGEGRHGAWWGGHGMGKVVGGMTAFWPCLGLAKMWS
ncbi:hypothetical protein PIB30_051468 [Stylosanthes scabra]|uniref:Uncharacterized protein n=1 Tax=Stylosanthes scabra TaxID=79078 RepID=A0ABU6VJW2_9FABA|nr:hypothetical protein [Stylosanthes scabra]